MKFLIIFAILSVLTATIVAEEPKTLADMKTLTEDIKELQKSVQDEELQLFPLVACGARFWKIYCKYHKNDIICVKKTQPQPVKEPQQQPVNRTQPQPVEQPQPQPAQQQITSQPQPGKKLRPKPVEQPTPQPTATSTINYGYPKFQYLSVDDSEVELIDESAVEDLKVNDISNNVAPTREIDELLAFLENY